MAIELNHTIMPARDEVAPARFFANILGLCFDESTAGYFAASDLFIKSCLFVSV